MTLDTKEEIKSEFNNILEILGKMPTSTVKWKNFRVYARIYKRRKELHIDEGKWKGANKNSRMMMLIHEVSHLTDDTKRNKGNHKLSFWKDYIRNYDKIEANKRKLDNRYDWNIVAKEIVKDVLPANIDRRQTTAGELRGRIESALGVEVDDTYPRDEYGAKIKEIDGVSVSLNYPDTYIHFDEHWNYGFGPDKVELGEELSEEELWEKFKEFRDKDPSISGSGKTSNWVIPTPKIKKFHDEYEKRYWDEEGRDKIKVIPCSRKDEILLQILKRFNDSTGVKLGCKSYT